MRKLIQSHVTRGIATGNKRRQEHSSQKKALVRERKSTQAQNGCELDVPSVPLKGLFRGGKLHYLDSIAIELQPRMRPVLLRYITGVASALYPMKFLFTFNPFRRTWFDYRMMDSDDVPHWPVHVFDVSWASSRCYGKRRSSVDGLVNRVISKRLDREVQVDDNPISAVSWP